jgi:hypothetical protein
MSRPRFKMRRTKDPGQDPHWQYVQSSASWLHLRPVPHKMDPTTSLRLARLARQVSAPHEKTPPCTTSPALTDAWAKTHGTSPRREHHHQRVWGTVPHAMQVQQLAAMQVSHPDKSLNAGLTDWVTIPSPSSLTMPHASSTRGTQAPSMTRTSLD